MGFKVKVRMKQLIFILTFIFLLPIAYSAGGFGEGAFDDGSFDFGTPAPEPEVQSSSSSSSGGGGGGGRLFDGHLDKFENGSRTEIFAYGDALQFYINNKKHTLVMIKLGKDYAKLRITPNYIDFVVNEFNSNIIDVDLDKKEDFVVSLVKVVNSYSAEFIFTILGKTQIKKITDNEIPSASTESIGGLNIEEEPKNIITAKPVTDEYIPKPEEEPKLRPIAWIITIIIIVLIIVLIVSYQNKEKRKKGEKI